MNEKPGIDYENLPGTETPDETERSLRAYLSQLSDEHLARYHPEWTDSQVIDWDGNFRSDGALMLVCCERDVTVGEFRQELEQHLRYRESTTRV